MTDADKPFISTGKLTCILHTINNFAGEALYDRNIYPLPHTLNEFLELFRVVPNNNVHKLVVIPSHICHIFSLLKVNLPVHIFAIKGTHIYNYIAADSAVDNTVNTATGQLRRHWWKIDSTYDICKKLHTVQLGMGDDLLVLALTRADEAALRDALISWNYMDGRRNEYYIDARERLLAQLSSDNAII
jgi:hypothetical protein